MERGRSEQQRSSAAPTRDATLSGEHRDDRVVRLAHSGGHPLSPASALGLQAALGNRATARAIARRQSGGVGTVQRRLDPAQFSKTAFSGQNLKAGTRLLGTSRFGAIQQALDAYHKTNNQADELAALERVVGACDAWLSSSYRTKKHAKAKQTEEDAKRKVVGDLKVAAVQEKNEITSHMHPDTFDRVGPDSGALAALSTLAGALHTTTDALKAMSDENLQAMYLDVVYAPLKMDRKANRDPGTRGQVHELMKKVEAVDLAKLPDGDTKDLVAKFKRASLGNDIALNGARAGKFSGTGTQDEAVVPGIKGWDNSKQVSISGNDEFRQKINGLLKVIAQTKVGSMLLLELGGSPPNDIGDTHSTAKETVLQIKPPSVSSAQRVDRSTGKVMYSNSAAGTSIAIDPDNSLLGENEDQGKKEPWRVRDGAVALFHEMIHIAIKRKGGEVFESLEDPSQKLRISDQGDIAELRIVGIDYKPDKVTYPFSDSSKNPVTENQFRKEYGELQNLDEVYFRPSYANVKGQVPLGSSPVKLS